MKYFKTFMGGLCMMAAVSCGGPAAENSECADACSASSSSKAVIENIMSRRSIRKYKPQTVARDTMNIILECGINAPNGQNKQSWEVRVVDNAATMDFIKEAMSAGRDVNVGSCFRGAPVMAFIARDPSYDFSAYDCGLLAQNMMLSATSLGVGSICLGSPVRFIMESPKKGEILERLGFSEGYELCLCVGFGYADEAPDAKPRDFGKVKFVD
ncbi:MAG: nitroreductase [Bacteroidaceae bacterium]|nr:nitroreductase [Bacteroidaceae bacterium]